MGTFHIKKKGIVSTRLAASQPGRQGPALLRLLVPMAPTPTPDLLLPHEVG